MSSCTTRLWYDIVLLLLTTPDLWAINIRGFNNFWNNHLSYYTLYKYTVIVPCGDLEEVDALLRSFPQEALREGVLSPANVNTQLCHLDRDTTFVHVHVAITF